MKITVIGAGYVGLVSAACLAELGNQVLCIDADADKVALLQGGGVPIYEPGLREMMARNRERGTLRFTHDMAAAVRHGDVQFIAVGTPGMADGAADLRQVQAAAEAVGAHMGRFTVVVNKSTVPVGTGEQVREAIAQQLAQRTLARRPEFAVVSNPEFLKEGAAIEDFMRPDRVVLGVGCDAASQRAEKLLRTLYAPFNRNHERVLVMDVRSAELTKYAANALLATKISFMNDMANLADALGADIEKVRVGIGSDRRIGYDFLYAGVGYGGSCFPKDVNAICHTAAQAGVPLRVLDAVRHVNTRQRQRFAERIVRYFGGSLRGKTLAVWGLAFKPHTDDVREAPSQHVVRKLAAAGARLQMHDPLVNSLPMLFPQGHTPAVGRSVTFCAQAMDALRGADALVILTEWKLYRSPDFAAIKKTLAQPLIFDGRNLFDPAHMRQHGLTYLGVGRRAA